MGIKKITTLFLAIFILNMNFVYAYNSVTVTAENGKSADLDLDSIKMAVDTVEYDIITELDGYTYVNKMSTELYKEGTPTAVVERRKYKGSISDGNLSENEKIKNRNYRVLKSGTLQSEIFDVLSKELGKKNFSKGKTTWNKYLKKQRKQIQKAWEPHKDNWDKPDGYVTPSTIQNLESIKDFRDWNAGGITPVRHDNVQLTINKDGSIKEKINDRGEFWNLTQLDALPEDYTAETFKLDVKMNYYKYAGAKIYTPKPLVKQISPVRSEITIAKNQRPPVIGHIQFGLLRAFKKFNNMDKLIPDPPDNGFLCLLGFPFVLVAGAGIIAGWIVTGLLCLLTGVSVEDMLN